MRYILFLTTLYLIVFSARADDDFDDFEDELESNRVVKLRDSKVSKKLSILSIKGFFFLNKILIRPIVLTYSTLTTTNFKKSVQDTLNNTSNIGDVAGNILIFSNQRLMANLGYITTNTTIGLFGTLDVAKKFNIKEEPTSTADVFRFYRLPEVYFFVFGSLPFTLPSTLAIPVGIAKSRCCDIIGIPFGNFGLSFLNSYALNIESFDIIARMKPEFIYTNLKDKTYAEAKYFSINRAPFERQTKFLQDKIQNMDLI